VGKHVRRAYGRIGVVFVVLQATLLVTSPGPLRAVAGHASSVAVKSASPAAANVSGGVGGVPTVRLVGGVPVVTPPRLVGDLERSRSGDRPVAGPAPVKAEAVSEALPVGFDARRSVPIEAETTESTVTFQNVDGSRTTRVAQGPVRWKGSDGQWRPIDLTLVDSGDGSLRASSHPGSAEFRSSAQGVVLGLDSKAGKFGVRVDGAADSNHVLAGVSRSDRREGRVTQSGALSDGRAVAWALRPEGAEVSAVLTSRAQSGSFDVSFDVPAGVSVVDESTVDSTVPSGVSLVFVDRDLKVVGRFGNGAALDGSLGSVGAVLVTVKRVTAGRVVVRVEVAAEWLASPARGRAQSSHCLDFRPTWIGRGCGSTCIPARRIGRS
jgi:hypothetical protein